MENKKRLIDANALQRRICGAKCGCEYEDCGCEGDCLFDHFIFHAPTVDAVEVVRCRDCKHNEHHDMLLYCGHIRGLAGMVSPDGFCYYGERIDNEIQTSN